MMIDHLTEERLFELSKTDSPFAENEVEHIEECEQCGTLLTDLFRKNFSNRF